MRSAPASSRSSSGSRVIRVAGSGSPACGSSAVIFASAVASSTTRSSDSRDRSDVDAAAEARPAKTRKERRCSREWLMFSISRMRTETLKWLSSTRKPSAAVAPRCAARLRTETSRSVFIVAGSSRPPWTEGGLKQARAGSAAAYLSQGDLRAPLAIHGLRVRSYRRSPYGDSVDPDRRQADADRHGLAVLAAGAHTLVELQVVADPRHARERLRAVADQGRALHRRGDPPVL